MSEDIAKELLLCIHHNIRVLFVPILIQDLRVLCAQPQGHDDDQCACASGRNFSSG